MKSRISYFDRTVFRKSMTRFAPAWILYTICLLLGMILLRQDYSAYGFHSNLSELTAIMSVINLFYALLAAQLLFGDLYNTRMCNAIHALPVTRESLFGTYTAAGLVWSILPTILGALLALVLGVGSEVKGGWHLPLWWLLGTNLQYLFFFGLAAFSALCVGNRFAQAVVYGIINFASVIAYWLVDTLYTPMLYGVQTNEEPFLLFSPVVWFANSEYIDVSRERAEGGEIIRAWYEVSEGWGYLAICAVVGVALLLCACLLYRRRNLECAGDFMAVKALEPVFLVVYPLIVAAAFYFFCDEMLYIGGIALVYMVVGLIIGFFTGLMLLERTIKIFSKKAFLKFAALAAGFGATLLLTALDPFGITTWVPDADDVVSVDVSPEYGYYTYNMITLEEPEDIEDVLRTHEIALEERIGDYSRYGYTVEYSADYDEYNPQTVSFHYHLSNGTTKSRYYVINLAGEAGNRMIPHFNTLEAIFRDYAGDTSFEGILNAIQTVSVGCDRYEGTEYKDMDGMFAINDPEEIRELLEAIVADAKLGVMAQNWNFRPHPDVGTAYWLEFDMGSQFESLTIYTDCVNTNAWLEEHSFISEGLEEIKKFGEVTAAYITG